MKTASDSVAGMSAPTSYLPCADESQYTATTLSFYCYYTEHHHYHYNLLLLLFLLSSSSFASFHPFVSFLFSPISSGTRCTYTHTQQMVSIRNINVEFSKETLETMLDGIGKIRDQLSSVAKDLIVVNIQHAVLIS